MGVPAYIIQHLGGAMADYQNGRMSGADNNVEPEYPDHASETTTR